MAKFRKASEVACTINGRDGRYCILCRACKPLADYRLNSGYYRSSECNDCSNEKKRQWRASKRGVPRAQREPPPSKARRGRMATASLELAGLLGYPGRVRVQAGSAKVVKSKWDK